MSSRVFVVQRPAYRDRATGEWITKFDLSPAEKFGELVDILPSNMFWDAETIVAQAERILNAPTWEFDPDHDFLLAIGDPVAIAACAIIASRHGSVTILKWDKKAQSYLPFCLDVQR